MLQEDQDKNLYIEFLNWKRIQIQMFTFLIYFLQGDPDKDFQFTNLNTAKGPRLILLIL